MKAANLDYARAPRPAVVFGCLMPAPWLGAAAGLLLACGPPDGLPHRFAPLALASVHVLALAMLLPVMLGALFQMMPVIARVPVPQVRWVAPFVALVGAGTAVALATGFVGAHATGFRWAAMLGLFPLLVAVLLLVAGRRVARVDATTRTLARIGAPLLATIAAGIGLAGMLGGGWTLPLPPWLPTTLPTLLSLHVAWGLGGWLCALVTGVSTTVLPMFWQARQLPDALQRCLPIAHWLLLLAFSVVAVAFPHHAFSSFALLPWLGFVVLLGGWMLAAVLRARRRHDPHWLLWTAAIASMVAAAILTAIQLFQPANTPMALPWWIGVLALVGGGVLPVTAMLGKIVPFLVWLHLRRLLQPRARVPVMQDIISPVRQRQQALLLMAAFVTLLALPLAPVWLARVGGLLFAASNAWLGYQLLTALRCMFRMRKQGGLPPRVPRD
ncbi:hypothetical protein [Cupriavidus pauculus]|uniref:Transmembrane protein n=1 Tax=Cupriavidus pauculus TaxID=82633 RepID=A0A2N5C599_9BURK|nr:hypothetical protein [Cupriavidus pauculus]PLP97399.1 hypothetical protein CYJ10_27475 [Cupriavidus pauculus]